VPTTQTLTTTAAFNNINSSSAGSNYVVSEDEISKKLPKEILLRILSYLDVVSLCRCAQVSIKCDGWKKIRRRIRKTLFVDGNLNSERVVVLLRNNLNFHQTHAKKNNKN
jgi:F-box-like